MKSENTEMSFIRLTLNTERNTIKITADAGSFETLHSWEIPHGLSGPAKEMFEELFRKFEKGVPKVIDETGIMKLDSNYIEYDYSTNVLTMQSANQEFLIIQPLRKLVTYKRLSNAENGAAMDFIIELESESIRVVTRWPEYYRSRPLSQSQNSAETVNIV